MRRRPFGRGLVILSVIAGLIGAVPGVEAADKKPNVVFILADNVGYGDLGSEMDPHEDLVVVGLYGWVSEPALKAVEEYLASVKKYPNPPAPNITQFGRGG